jgi:hypothetical protein
MKLNSNLVAALRFPLPAASKFRVDRRTSAPWRHVPGHAAQGFDIAAPPARKAAVISAVSVIS